MATAKDKLTGMTAEILRMLVIYDLATGEMRSRAGKILGTRMRDRNDIGDERTGHVRIEFSIFGRFGFLRHRLAWLYMTGQWPEDQIDHKNLVKFDDRWDNLREASNDKNQANRGLRPHNTSGITGVSFHPSQGKWYAGLSIGGERVLHAYFNSEDMALEARKCALVAHGDFAFRGDAGHGG